MDEKLEILTCNPSCPYLAGNIFFRCKYQSSPIRVSLENPCEYLLTKSQVEGYNFGPKDTPDFIKKSRFDRWLEKHFKGLEDFAKFPRPPTG